MHQVYPHAGKDVLISDTSLIMITANAVIFI